MQPSFWGIKSELEIQFLLDSIGYQLLYVSRLKCRLIQERIEIASSLVEGVSRPGKWLSLWPRWEQRFVLPMLAEQGVPPEVVVFRRLLFKPASGYWGDEEGADLVTVLNRPTKREWAILVEGGGVVVLGDQPTQRAIDAHAAFYDEEEVAAWLVLGRTDGAIVNSKRITNTVGDSRLPWRRGRPQESSVTTSHVTDRHDGTADRGNAAKWLSVLG